jgi:hypothetical protein
MALRLRDDRHRAGERMATAGEQLRQAVRPVLATGAEAGWGYAPESVEPDLTADADEEQPEEWQDVFITIKEHDEEAAELRATIAELNDELHTLRHRVDDRDLVATAPRPPASITADEPDP